MVKAEKATKACPRLPQMRNKFDQYPEGIIRREIRTLDCNLLYMRKLSNGGEECVPINVGCFRVFPQLCGVIEPTEVYDDVGDTADTTTSSVDIV